MALISGTKLGPYEIQSPLGAGGMGEVYRATDTKLGRDVALKVLPADMAHDPERLARFRREAKALAQLDHPNIVTIHSVEESDGVHFLTMQLVEGQPLDRLIPAGGLPVEQIVEIASALADALAAAHEKGIVHRDLKPANVMVSNEDRVKVLDFGLAKDIRATNLGDATLTSASQTQVGVVMGTPAYMSPEQTSGRPLDHRTDIFSLGVVLHEMATGRRPFEATSSAELVSAILRDTAPSVTDVRPDLPGDLARIVRRCLEKDPRRRVQTARDVSNEFRDLARQTSRPLAPATTSAARVVSAADSGASRAEEGFWVAVLPFRYVGSNADITALGEGLTEDIVTGLSRFSYLRVIARSSTSHYANKSVDVRSAGKELGARYVMEGSLRQAGTKVRLAVQLVDTTSGAHLWAENYERDFQTGEIFALQDDLVPRIVSTVADQYGILPRSMSEALRGKSEDQLTPHEAVLRTFSYFTRITPEEHAAVGKILERAVRDAPDHADSWAMLSMIYRGEFAQGFNAGPNPLDRALAAAQRAVDLAATHALGHYALATVYFFRKEMVPFRVEAERALALNPLDASVRAYLGLLIAAAGEWDRGCQMVESAMQLNPNCPGYFYFARCCNGYRQGRYAEVLEGAARVNMPGYFHTHALRAATLGQLGRREEARKAVQDLLALRPDFAAAARQEYAKWYDSELVEQLIDGLRKAGLEIPQERRPATVALKSEPSSAPDSGAVRADEGFWVAVLPFKYGGANTDLTALAEGLTEDIVAGLSRFSYLRVIARGSTARYSSESGDVRAIGEELGARYVMEGSLRQAGTRLRLAVRLVDATSGAHLWAETYDRAFVAEEIFELQDDLVPRIVSTVADTHGVLPYSMHQTVRNKNPDELSPYEALLRGFAYFKHVNAADHAGARAALEKAVQRAPGNADCWAMLSMLYREENNHGFNVRPDPVGRALAAARRAVDTAPSNHLAHHALASVLFFRRETQAFRSAAQRAIELNPMDGFTIGYMGFLISYSGDWERGCALMEKARNLNPNHPGWYWFPPFFNAYRKGDYRAALEFALKVNMPGFWRNELALAATYGQLGELELARNAALELLAVRPDFAVVAWEECRKWWDPELVEQIIDGLRKAGLEIGDKQGMTAKPEARTGP
jgi:TolB-like protein/Tfp pilus assembly protein PilF